MRKLFSRVEPRDLMEGDLVTAPYGNGATGTVVVDKVNKEHNSFEGHYRYQYGPQGEVQQHLYKYKEPEWYDAGLSKLLILIKTGDWDE